MLFGHRRAKVLFGRTCCWRLKKATALVWLLWFGRFPLFSRYARCPAFWFLSSWDEGLLFLLNCVLSFSDGDQRIMVMLVVDNLWFDGVFFFCRDEDNGRADLWLSSVLLFFSVYFIFVFCAVIFFVLFFSALYFLVISSVFLGSFFLRSQLCFSGLNSRPGV